jgi:hypothetical protein
MQLRSRADHLLNLGESCGSLEELPHISALSFCVVHLHSYSYADHMLAFGQQMACRLVFALRDSQT